MATVVQLWQPATGMVGKNLDVPYAVFDAADETAVRVAALAQVPTTYDGLPRRSIDLDQRINETTWTVMARFEALSYAAAEGDPDSAFEFDTTGGSTHITQAKATSNSYGSKKSSDNKGAIGFDGQNVQGADIVTPVFNFSETHFFSDVEVTNAYRQDVFALTGKVSSGAFRGFSAKEVLFLGAMGHRRGDDWDDPWELTFNFAAQQNETGLTIGDITGIAKKGWELLDVRYDAVADEAVKTVLKQPVAVYVHRVYDDGDFSDLNLPT